MGICIETQIVVSRALSTSLGNLVINLALSNSIFNTLASVVWVVSVVAYFTRRLGLVLEAVVWLGESWRLALVIDYVQVQTRIALVTSSSIGVELASYYDFRVQYNFYTFIIGGVQVVVFFTFDTFVACFENQAISSTNWVWLTFLQVIQVEFVDALSALIESCVVSLALILLVGSLLTVIRVFVGV
ncbi:MAG: hypothetical protein DHS20C13_27120 [Thermodesulfobacteriota bacterium]|nr:MAG: hypothetical protein DHS20C13_27120 [Thermodesulfobacteriota bacterium]